MEIFKPDYTMIDSMIFFPALILSLFVRRNYFQLLKSIAIVSPLYLFWDFLATWKDSWSFNPKYVMGIYVINLPMEEVMFFLVTPFATLLIFDFVMNSVRDREVKWVQKSDNNYNSFINNNPSICFQLFVYIYRLPLPNNELHNLSLNRKGLVSV